MTNIVIARPECIMMDGGMTDHRPKSRLDSTCSLVAHSACGKDLRHHGDRLKVHPLLRRAVLANPQILQHNVTISRIQYVTREIRSLRVSNKERSTQETL